MINRKIFFILFVLCSLSYLLPNSLRAQEEYVGTLQIIAIDEINKITGALRCKYAYYLKAEDGILYRIEDTEGVLRKLKSSVKIKISGDKIGNKIIVNTAKSFTVVSPKSNHINVTAATEDTAETIGEQKTLVALFNYTDKQDKPFTIDEVKNWILNDTDSVNNFIKENSYDKTWLTVDFVDFMTLPNNSTYYTDSLLLDDDAITTLDSTVNYQDYARLIFFYLNNGEDDWPAGRGSLSKGNWSSDDGDFTASVSAILMDTPTKEVISHEFGHNLGFYHSSAVACTDGQYHIPESLWDPTSSCGTDTFEEYGDDDTMGGRYSHFSTIWKSQAKWIDSSQIQETVNSEYTIDQVELSSSGTKILKIPLGKDNYGNDFYYWVEYRKNLGTFDKEDIVQIRTKLTRVYDGSTWGVNSLRFKKSTRGDYVDIDTDDSFYDPYRGVRIELIEKTGSGSDSKAKIKVVMAPQVTTGSKTNMTLSSVTLNGTVNAYGETTNVWFEYGTNSGSYSNTTSTKTVSGTADTTVSIDISGLSEKTTYYYRIVAQNSNGTVYGKENTFILITVTPKISEGRSHTIVLKSDGTVWAWGDNTDGQLGDGTTTNRTTPVQVSGLSGVTAIAGGGYYSIALKSDGTVWAWGENSSGQLGDGTTTDRSTPVQVSSLSGVTAIAGGLSHTIGLKSDGTVWAWGYNDEGQLGDGTTTKRTTPVQVSGLSGVIAIAGGEDHSLALKSDGTVWAWGDNTDGQLGDGTTTDREFPVQVEINLGETPDTFVPTGSININSGATYTNSTTVTLNLSASDGTGVAGYYLSTNSTKPSSDDTGWTSISSITSYSADVSYTLSSGDGSKTVYVWYKDAAGNVSDTASDSITLDTTVPICEAETITVSPTSLTIKREKSVDVTVTVPQGEYGCSFTVKATINAAGKKRVSISPTNAMTDENGEAIFTITAKKKTGAARVIFNVGSLMKSITVRVMN